MSIGKMNSVVIFVLFAVLTTAFVGSVTASCKQVANDEMLEYFCEGGHPADLFAIPVITEKLRISRMPLRRITADTFSRFGGNLWVLGCSHCNITDIDVDAFRGLVNLQQLGLDNNRLTSVRAAWFEGLSHLTYLDLNYNNIHEIEDGVYRNLPYLVDLRISGNRLRCLNLDVMSHLKELKFMLLSENPDFACPHAVSKFLESQNVTFEKDPEWARLVSDVIDVHVPPSYEEDDHTTTPAYYEKLYPNNRRPSEEQETSPHVPPPSRDRGFYPNHQSEHHGRPRRPTTVRPTIPNHKEPMPRVEPGSIRIASNERSSQAEHTLTHPTYVPTSETYYPYTISERPQTPAVNYDPRLLSEDTRTDEVNRSLQTERTLTSYISTYGMPQTTPERSQTIGSASSSQYETTTGFDRPLRTENVVTYPLYAATSGDYEGHVFSSKPTTDKPLPECPNRNSATLMIQSAAVLVLSVIVIFGHRVIAEGF